MPSASKWRSVSSGDEGSPKRGVSKAVGLADLVTTLIVKTFLKLLGGIVLAFALFFIVGAVLDTQGNANLGLLAGLLAVFLFWPAVSSVNIVRVWAAL